MIKKSLIPLLLSLTLTGCGLFGAKKPGQYATDGPPKRHRDVSRIPNAKPKVEPLSRYGNPPTYTALGKRYSVMKEAKGFEETGTASWYGRKFHGQRTSSGEPYDMFAMTAAHKALPLPTYATVKNLDNGKEVIVKINDRGPFIGDRVIDLSYAAAKKLGVYDQGTARVKVTAIDPATWGTKSWWGKAQKSPPTEPKQIFIQIGAFGQKDNAQMLAQKASTVLEAPVEIIPHAKKTPAIYKVRIGPITDEGKARTLQQQLISQLAIDSPVITHE